jgi:hypothetical protein
VAVIAVHDQRLYYHQRELVNFRKVYERRVSYTPDERLYTPTEAPFQFFGIPEHGGSVGMLYRAYPAPQGEPVHAFYRLVQRGPRAFKAKGLLAYLHSHPLTALKRCISGLFRAYGWSGVVPDFPLTPPKRCGILSPILIKSAPSTETISHRFLSVLLQGNGDLDATMFPWEILTSIPRSCLRLQAHAVNKLGHRVLVLSGINAGWSLWVSRLLRFEYGVKEVLPVCLFLV